MRLSNPVGALAVRVRVDAPQQPCPEQVAQETR
jgi:hypothetical protein